MRAGETMNTIPGSRAGRGRARTACFLGLLAVLCAARAATADPPSEAAVKAAFVYNFAKFVEWPAKSSAQNGLTLCIAGARPELAASLVELAGKSVQGHTLSVKNNVSPADLDVCHVLFLGSDARPLAGQARGRAGLLTVSDMPGFAQSGGVIGLFSDGDRIRFEINPRSAEAAGLKVSSQLMKLAKVVEP
jgi:hypothetical protein